ncbi:MAG: hypothetical protein COA85_05640 [Robiginitomaculum sp.]|nr:MAG: hypothetical protein COA85_05640 [Robiginitomaculum sp.]
MNTGPLIAIALFALLFVVAALRAVLGYRWVHRDAREEWPDYKKNQPRLTKGLNEDQYVQAYVRTHGPRGALYGAVMLITAAILTPVIMLMLTALYGILIAEPMPTAGTASANLAGEVGRQFRLDGPLVYAFFLFFGLIASWGGVAFVVAHRFHRNRPGSLEEELRLARGEDELPDAPTQRQRPKWSPLVQTDDGLKMPVKTNVKPDKD